MISMLYFLIGAVERSAIFLSLQAHAEKWGRNRTIDLQNEFCALPPPEART